MREQPALPEGFVDPKLPTGVLSHSQYALYRKCPSAYERRYLRNQRTPTSPAMFRGIVVHSAIEKALLHKKATATAMSLEEAADELAETFGKREKEVEVWDEGEPSGKVLDAAQRAFAVWHAQAYPKINPVEVESFFARKVGSVPVTGYIDLIDHVRGPDMGGVADPGYYVVADTKTGSASWSQAEIDADPQFTLYSLVRGVPHVRVDALALLKAGPKYDAKTSRRTARDWAILREDYEEVADLIKRGIFPKAPIDAWSCNAKWCAHWRACRGNPHAYGGAGGGQ